MGMAGAAPFDTYKRRFGITTHAIERYRERAGDWLRERGHLDDVAVGNSLDSRICDAWDAGRFVEVLDKGATSRIVDLESKEFGRLYAVLVPNNMPTSAQRWVVPTVLTGEYHDAAWTSGRWKLPDAEPESLHTVGLMAALAAATPETKPSPSLVPEGLTLAPVPASYLLTWEEDAIARYERFTSKEEAREVVIRLHLKKVDNLRVHAELPLHIKVEADF